MKADTTAGIIFHLATGCPADTDIPLQPTLCAHWDADCFGDQELMIPAIVDDGDDQKVSEYTIAVLNDFGFTVDFDAGEQINPNKFSDECMCEEGKHRDAPLSTTGKFGKKIKGRTTRPSPSDTAIARAKASGRKFLSEQRGRFEAAGGDAALRGTGDDLAFIGDKVVAVMLREGDYLFDIVVYEND